MMKKEKQRSPAAAKPVTVISEKDQKSIRRWLLIICGLFAFLLYANTLMHDFVLDDETAIGKNSFTKEGISALPEIFSTPYRAGFWDRNEGLYRPLSIALFAIEWQLAPSNPHFFHWVNVLLYAITAIMLFITLSLFFEKKNILLPFIATMLFVAHPIHTEVVANIKSADELLCFLFSLISLWALMKYAKEGRMLLLIAAGIAVFFAMLSKETAITMVVVAPMTIYFFTQANARKIAISTLPFLVAFFIYLTIRISVLKGLTNFNEIQLINNSLAGAGNDLVTRYATAISIIGKYLLLLVIPQPLCFDYSYNTIPLVSISAPQALLSLAIIIGLAVVVIRGLKTKSPLAWSILFFGATLSLTSNLFFLIEATLGERFLFMPSLGFCVGITFISFQLFKADLHSSTSKNIRTLINQHKAIIAVSVLVLLLFSAKTIARNTDWKDNLTLTKIDSQTHPNSARIRYAYGSILVMEKGLIEKDENQKKNFLSEGVRQLTEAVKILPDYGEAWFNLGMGYKELEDYKSAVTCFENAGENMTEKNFSYYVAAGVAYGETGEYEKSFAMLNKAIQLDSTSSDPYNNMGLFYSRLQNYPQSIALLSKAMQLNPKDEYPPYNLGNTYANMGDFSTAIEYYKKALAINPNSEMTLVNLGNSYGALKDYPNALITFKKVLEINPANKNAINNMGATYYLMGDTANANKYLPTR